MSWSPQDGRRMMSYDGANVLQIPAIGTAGICNDFQNGKRKGRTVEKLIAKPLRNTSSGGHAGAVAGGPSPLEVETAEVTGHIHDLADEVQARHFARFHGLGRQL